VIKRLPALLRDTRGATAVEYSIIAVIISIAGVGVLVLIGPAVMQMFSDAGSAF
jgi:Flp pilus assembly pilin Flp